MDIPADMVEEIFLRLPVKTLLRFKSVCRRWFSLIGSRSFADRHYLRQGKSNQECQLLADLDNDLSEYFSVYPDLRDQKVRSHILGPAKGVFCEVGEDGTLILWNPAMREVKTVLPPLPLLPSTPVPADVSVHIRMRALAFGFGLDPSSGAFKIVAFTKTASKESHPAACVVYNSTTNSWKHLGVGDLLMTMKAMPRARWCHRKSRYLNGVYYWLLRSRDWIDAAILSFDMVTEEFRELIAGPDRGRLTFWHLRLAVYRDSLALMTMCELGECRCVDLWVMVGRVWKHRFSMGRPCQDMAWLLCLWSDTDRHELFLETLDFSDQIPSDLMSTTSTMMLGTPREIPPSDALPQYVVIPYKESLLSIKGHLESQCKCIQCYHNLFQLLPDGFIDQVSVCIEFCRT